MGHRHNRRCRRADHPLHAAKAAEGHWPFHRGCHVFAVFVCGAAGLFGRGGTGGVARL